MSKTTVVLRGALRATDGDDGEYLGFDPDVATYLHLGDDAEVYFDGDALVVMTRPSPPTQEFQKKQTYPAWRVVEVVQERRS